MNELTQPQLMELIVRIHEQHEYLAQQANPDLYRDMAYSKAKPIPTRFAWPDLPTEREPLDRLLGEAWFRAGVQF